MLPVTKASNVQPLARVRAIAPKTTVMVTPTSTLSVIHRAMQAANITIEPQVTAAPPPPQDPTVTVSSPNSTRVDSQSEVHPTNQTESIFTCQTHSMTSNHVTSPSIAMTTDQCTTMVCPSTPLSCSSSTSLSLDLLLTPTKVNSSEVSHHDMVAEITTEDALLEFSSQEQSEGFISAVANAISVDALDSDKTLDTNALLCALSSVPFVDEDTRMSHSRMGTPSKTTPSPIKTDLSDLLGLNENSISGFLAQSPSKEPFVIDGKDLSSGFRQMPEMDMAICSVLEENSVDYVNKFKDLTAQIATATTPKKFGPDTY